MFNLTPNFLSPPSIYNRNIYHFGNNTVSRRMRYRAIGEHAASECPTGFVIFRVRQTGANSGAFQQLSTMLEKAGILGRRPKADAGSPEGRGQWRDGVKALEYNMFHYRRAPTLAIAHHWE
ncbi:hypothetical protein MGAD_55210 [Mycolicibacterium gadium]|uniref:Uncharacterized protein n=1 Tax=Mycolicibacterium gadium TaxID=1794 RepID=A0A7I7WU29_MYCGU|nr:hypothetical protein MGAD_55210 [Mycolicibacterium gadium]